MDGAATSLSWALLGLALSVLSIWGVVEGLAAPGFLVTNPETATFAAAVALPAGLLAAIPLLIRAPAMTRSIARQWRAWVIVWLAGSGLAAVLVLAAGPSMQTLGPAGSTTLASLGAGGAGLAGLRQSRLYRIGRRRENAVAAAAAACLGLAAMAGPMAVTYGVVWWSLHLVDLLAVLAAISGLATLGWRERSLAATLRPVINNDPLVALELGLTPVVHAFIAALNTKDITTRDHVVRVAELAMRVARRSGLSPSRQRRTGLGALMHDIGKLVIPSQILTKPGALTDEEYECIKTHSAQGAALLADFPGVADVAPIVRGHHERFDGHGYPDGLIGDAIPFEAAIVSVCDAWDAMSNARHYRNALELERARSILNDGAGSQWNPWACELLVSVLEEEPLTDAYADVGHPHGDGPPAGPGASPVCCDAVPVALLVGTGLSA